VGDVSISDINQHIKRIHADHELESEATIKKYLTVQTEGERNVNREVIHYNLQMIIAVGFKVNNERAVRFRKWAAPVVKEYLTTGADGKNYKTKFYNLDVIISVGYRVKSQRGVQFRIWATNILKEYIKKGFAMDDARLKELGGGGYFKELLARIRDIRASEKVFYRQVLEIYATSVDYNPKAEVSIEFF